MDAEPPPVLRLEDLSVEFATRGGPVRALRGASFSVAAGRTLCVVGESGSGKSVAARCVLGLVPPPGRITGGRVLLRGADGAETDLAALDPRGPAIRAVRGRRVAMIFQEPMASLSPVHRIGFQIEEAIRLHTPLGREARRARCVELLRSVEIPSPEAAAARYPFEFSGGMRQRAMIAMALACEPEVLIADEPTTALDVTTQAEILDLLRRLQEARGTAVVLITHDMGVVAEVAQDVAVMRSGEVVETGPVGRIFDAPRHPYTRMLIETARRLETRSPLKAPPPTEGAPPLLEVSGLSKTYVSRVGLLRPRELRHAALADAALVLREGETLGVVGESGSGKTTLGRCLLRLIEPDAGAIRYRARDGGVVDVARADRQGLRRVRREVRMIFQDPYASLNPRMTVEQIVGEPLRNAGARPAAVRARVAELLDLVGLSPEHADRYPHAFSGGQRQRIGIARALAPSPRLVVADEATSALDVSLRAQVLDLLLGLQSRLGLSMVMISHDIATIRYACDRVIVMHRGRIVESGPVERVCDRPEHPYTRALLSAVPRPDPGARRLGERLRYRPDEAAEEQDAA